MLLKNINRYQLLKKNKNTHTQNTCICKSISLPFSHIEIYQTSVEGGGGCKPNTCVQRDATDLNDLLPPRSRNQTFFFFFSQPQSDMQRHLSSHRCQQLILWETSKHIVQQHTAGRAAVCSALISSHNGRDVYRHHGGGGWSDNLTALVKSNATFK